MNKFWFEVLRLVPLLGLAAIVILPDDARHVIFFGVAIIFLGVALAHGIRKLIFPYIDVKTLAEKAKETAMSSAVVILGLIYLLSTIIQSLVALLR
jgi:hypothetical protein